MSKNQQEYQMLTEMREALISVKKADEGIKEAQKSLQGVPADSRMLHPDKYKFHLPELQDLITKRINQMKHDYLLESYRKTNVAIFWAMLGLVIVTAALIFVTIYFPMQKYHDIYKENAIWGEYIEPHITFLGAFVVIDILTLIGISLIISNSSEGILLKISKWIVIISLIVAGIVALCVSVRDMWISQEGNFQILSFLLANILCILRWLLGIVFWIPFMIVICVAIFLFVKLKKIFMSVQVSILLNKIMNLKIRFVIPNL